MRHPAFIDAFDPFSIRCQSARQGCFRALTDFQRRESRQAIRFASTGTASLSMTQTITDDIVRRVRDVLE